MGSRGNMGNIIESGGYTIQNSNGTLYIRDSYGKIIQEVDTIDNAEEIIRNLTSGEYQRQRERRAQDIKEVEERQKADRAREKAMAEIRRRFNIK